MNNKQWVKWAMPIMILFLINTMTYAEVITDGTLGQALNLPGPEYQIQAELGQQHGGNLFHSFNQFNLNQHESATFSGPNTVQNIISRVTGGNPSTIEGTLRSTIPKADFYFLNPNGMMFGPNARLDVQGAFYASTAHYLKLGDKGRFDASHPENSLLSVAPITAFGFLDQAAPITLQDSQMRVSEHNRFALIGGSIDIINSKLYAASGNIYLNSVAGNAEVSTDYEKGTLDNLPEDSQLTLSQNTTLSTDSNSTADAGEIDMRAGKITIRDNAYISSNTQDIGNAGRIEIQTHHFTITDFANLSSNTLEGGMGGIIRIFADQSYDMSGETLINTSSAETHSPAGTVSVITDEFTMRDNAIIYTASESGTGKAGQVLIQADHFSLMDTSKIMSSTFSQGDGGNIDITAETAVLTGESAIASTTFGEGKGGDITFQADQMFSLLDQAVIDSSTQSKGAGGNITLKIDQLIVAETAMISAESGTENPFIREITRLAELADWLGAQSYGDFSKGGRGGKVCISQPGEQCDNNSIVAILAKNIQEISQSDCLDHNALRRSWFKQIARKGLFSSPDDMQTH